MGVGEVAGQLLEAREALRGEWISVGHGMVRHVVGDRSGQVRHVDPQGGESFPQPLESRGECVARQVPPSDDTLGFGEEEEPGPGRIEGDTRWAARRLEPRAGEEVLAPDPFEGRLSVVGTRRQQRSPGSGDDLRRVMEQKARLDEGTGLDRTQAAPMSARILSLHDPLSEAYDAGRVRVEGERAIVTRSSGPLLQPEAR